MAAGSSYPVDVLNPEQTEVKLSGYVKFTDSTVQPVPSAPPITSGTLPDTGAWVSGTAKVNPVSRQITVAVEVVTDGTNNAATCAIAVSPDNVTYTTLGTPTVAAAINTSGAIKMLSNVTLPQGWYIKLTLSHTTVAASFYY
jgi:hypothetical protein